MLYPSQMITRNMYQYWFLWAISESPVYFSIEVLCKWHINNDINTQNQLSFNQALSISQWETTYMSSYHLTAYSRPQVSHFSRTGTNSTSWAAPCHFAHLWAACANLWCNCGPYSSRFGPLCSTCGRCSNCTLCIWVFCFRIRFSCATWTDLSL